jgi:hypothetical protein
MMIQVRVERDAVAIEQLVPLAVAKQNDAAPLDERGLAAPGLVPRRISRTPCDRSRRKRVARELGSPFRRSPARTTVTAPSSSRRSSWESRSSSPPAIRFATWSVGLVSPRSTCESIGALTPERSARSRSDRSMASRSARMRGPRPPSVLAVAVVVDNIRAYVITYAGRDRTRR